jgi:hypothetical protein
MDERTSFIHYKKARKQQEHQRQKKGTDEQTIKASVGQKRDRDREPLGS